MVDKPSQHPLQRLDAGSLSRRLEQLSGGGPVKGPTDISTSSARLLPKPPEPEWRGVVLLLIDVSVSMAGESLNQAKQGSIGFAREAIGLRYDVGLIAFGDNAWSVASATRNAGAIEDAATRLEISGSTNMAAAISLATTQLGSGRHERVMLLVTDGQPNDREGTLDAASVARRAGIDIMTLGTEQADGDFLRQLASRSALARTVSTAQLQLGIQSSAKLLLGR